MWTKRLDMPQKGAMLQKRTCSKIGGAAEKIRHNKKIWACWRACERNRPEVVIGRTNRAIRALLWLLPQKLMVRLMPGPI